ncbi:nucleotidyltransferase domain-containing protein [Streptomyces sp. NPDC093248]|uniref:nucleotidyltransferase domain-containing protein n=1 Tax=Streptomyces sp. NPDC093248 TaxID=3155072 RepID=UPI0034386FC6
MIRRLDGDTSWPLALVQEVWLFGSFARGALEPHDVDVAVRFERDERMDRGRRPVPALRAWQFPTRRFAARSRALPAGCSSSSRIPRASSLRPRER